MYMYMYIIQFTTQKTNGLSGTHQLDPPMKAVALVDADADNHHHTCHQHHYHCSHHVDPDLWAGSSSPRGLHRRCIHKYRITPVARQLMQVRSTDLELCVCTMSKCDMCHNALHGSVYMQYMYM